MMKGQLAGLMKQAQQMQENLRKKQEELALIEVEGQSGAGLVKVVLTCRNEVKRISIDPSLLEQSFTSTLLGGDRSHEGPGLAALIAQNIHD